MAKESPIVAARRICLREWIDTHHDGKQAGFVRTTGINQGELSALLKSKSFREEKAANIEKAAKMPEGYLTRPIPGALLKVPAAVSSMAVAVAEPAATYHVDPSAAIERLKSDIQSLRQIIGLLTVALAQNVPDAVERVTASLRQNQLPIGQNFLHEYLSMADKALALRREGAGPQHNESIPTSGAARRP